MCRARSPDLEPDSCSDRDFLGDGECTDAMVGTQHAGHRHLGLRPGVTAVVLDPVDCAAVQPRVVNGAAAIVVDTSQQHALGCQQLVVGRARLDRRPQPFERRSPGQLAHDQALGRR